MPIVMNGRSRGFTLVEMSIVLVIIGLIIGGILKGQEIIASARQKAVINQVNAVRAATNTYFDRYRALPGDDPNAQLVDSSLCNGDGNGIVGTCAGNTASAIATSGNGTSTENYNFFDGLVAANLLNGAQVTSGSTSATTFGITALPAAPITGAGLTVVYGEYPNSNDTAQDKTTHWLRLHKTASSPTLAISPRTLANIDEQTDDGLPASGGVRSSSSGCDSGTAYVSSDNILCIGLFEVTQ